MMVTLVHVYVLPQYIDDFIKATRENHEKSVAEHGNFRFDVLQDANDPSKFVLYEAYDSEESAGAHKYTTHYLKWRDTVGPWMAKAREGQKHRLLFPAR